MDQKENTLSLTLLISSIVLLAFIIFFTFTIFWYHRKRKSIQKELEKRNLAKLEQQRHQIAGNLQNLLSPLFHNILVHINQLTLAGQPNQQLLSETGNLVSQTIEQLQEVVTILLPQRLEAEGLKAALLDLSRSIQSTHNLVIQVESGQLPRLLPDKETHIFRIVEEIVQNTVLHARASQVFINISASDKTMTLLISDDGVGLDFPAVQKEKALGLHSILAHADQLDAEILLEGKPGEGTTYLISIPLH